MVEKNVKNYWSTDQGRSQPKNLGRAKKWGAKCLILTNNPIFFAKTPLKAQNDYIF